MRANRTIGAVLDADAFEAGGTTTMTTMMIEPTAEQEEYESTAPADRSAADLALARRMLQALQHREDHGRRSKVDRLREAIESNSYENPLKLSVALDRLVDKVGGCAGNA